MSASFAREFWILADKLFKLLSNVVTVFVLSPALGLEMMGEYYFFETILLFVLCFCLFGFDGAGIKMYLDGSSLRVGGTILNLRMILGLLSASLVFVAGVAGYLTWEKLVVLMWVILFASFSIVEQYLLSKNLHDRVYKVKVIFSIISILFKVIATYFSLGVVLLIVTLVFDYVAIGIYGFGIYILARLRRIPNVMCFGPLGNYKRSRDYAVYLAPIFISSFLVLVHSKVSQIMLAGLATYEELGRYSLSMRMTELFVFVPSALSVLYLPAVYKKCKAFSDDFLAVFFNAVFVCYVLSAICSGAGYLYLNAVAPGTLVSGPVYLLAVLGGVANFFGVVVSQLQIYEGRFARRLIRIAAGLVLALILNIFLIPWLGVDGAVISWFCSVMFSHFLLLLIWSDTRRLMLLFFRGAKSGFLCLDLVSQRRE